MTKISDTTLESNGTQSSDDNGDTVFTNLTDGTFRFADYLTILQTVPQGYSAEDAIYLDTPQYASANQINYIPDSLNPIGYLNIWRNDDAAFTPVSIDLDISYQYFSGQRQVT